LSQIHHLTTEVGTTPQKVSVILHLAIIQTRVSKDQVLQTRIGMLPRALLTEVNSMIHHCGDTGFNNGRENTLIMCITQKVV